MEISFSELKRKETINLLDGKQLGKVCDVIFTWPEGRVQGIVVPGGKGIRWGKTDLFIDIRCVKKIGIDVILVETKSGPKPEKKRGKCEDNTPEPPPFYRGGGGDRRDYGEYE